MSKLKRIDSTISNLKTFSEVNKEKRENQLASMKKAQDAFSLLDAVMSQKYCQLWTKTRLDNGKNKDIWIAQFAIVEIDQERVKYALEKLIQDPQFARMPPTVGEFVLLAEPELADFGLLSASDAYIKACHSNYPDVVVRAAASKTGCWDLRNRPERETRSKFEKIYNDLARRYIAGDTNVIPENVERKHIAELEDPTHRIWISVDKPAKKRVGYKKSRIAELRKALDDAGQALTV